MAAGSERAARCSVATAHSASETLLRRGLTSPWKAQGPPGPLNRGVPRTTSVAQLSR